MGIERSSEVMEGRNPLVSVIMPCYNHEKYVGEAIESVLNQTYDNFEFIVADNGSTDNSYTVIQRYKDRITKIIQLEKNDPYLCGKKLRELVKGKYIAIMTSDDYWEKEKLELQMQVFVEHPEVKACSTWAVQTDENLQPLSDKKNIFTVENRNRYQWLKHFAFYGNCLAWPSTVLETELFDRIEEKGYRQLSDLYCWIQIVQKAEIYVVPQMLVKFRWHRNGNNCNESTPTEAVINRDDNEKISIIDDIFHKVEDSYFIKAFQNEFIHPDVRSHEELLCEKFFLLKRLSDTQYSYEACALNFYFEHFAEIKDIMDKDYKFSYADFHNWSGHAGIRAHNVRLANSVNALTRAKQKKDEQIQGLKNLIFEDMINCDDLIELRRKLFQMLSHDDRQLILEIRNIYTKVVEHMESEESEKLYYSLVDILQSTIQKMDLLWSELEFIEFPISREDWDMYKELIGYAKQEVIDLTESVLPFTKHIQEQLELVSEEEDAW